jgi:hypothetical protein
MKNNSNIYDIDGELIRPIDDNHQWTIEEAKNRVNYYQEKIQQLNNKEDKTEEDKQKIRIYTQYCTNLINYEWSKMMKMDPNDLLNTISPKTTEEDVNNALNELNNDIETGDDTENSLSEQPTGDNEYTTNEELRDDEAIERSNSDVHEERSISQSDLLVERDNVTNNMDEYVDFEEV